jgi:hypothetical protein
MLSSFACAIPGIMATRTRESKGPFGYDSSRAAYELSACLPVLYSPDRACNRPARSAFLKLSGLTMLGILVGDHWGLLMAWLFKKTLQEWHSHADHGIASLQKTRAESFTQRMWDRSNFFGELERSFWASIFYFVSGDLPAQQCHRAGIHSQTTGLTGSNLH